MPNVKKAIRTQWPTKDDPPGTRWVKGTKMVPFAGPKPAKRERPRVPSKTLTRRRDTA